MRQSSGLGHDRRVRTHTFLCSDVRAKADTRAMIAPVVTATLAAWAALELVLGVSEALR